ncbi:SRPBCC family protein [Rhizomonospora bruguierae]|uniref:SRPBCC family protein n=1 Tax=Rhizomonospora bruguierae TaxID=1581705 RepID=UPI001BCB51BE|nr:SRPBCC domain-containing protein [Micromonospora sp. NBRC 107566]
MSTVVVTRAVAAPVERVWGVFTDLPARAAWLSTVESVEVLPGPAFGAGTAWRETREMADGLRVTEEFRVLECRPRECCVVASPGDGAEYRMTYTFTERRGQTTVTAVQEAGPVGTSGRLLAAVLGGLAVRVSEGALRADLDDLAAAAERMHPVP